MEEFIFIDDLTSDVMFEAYGKDFKELLINCAKALFSVVCDIKQVKAECSFEVILEEENKKELLHAWLSRILTESEIEGLFLSRFEIKELLLREGSIGLMAEVFGEPLSPEKGETVVKGVTYYGFSIKKGPHGYKARAALDI